MKNKILVQTIADPDTQVKVNSAAHRIEEIKKEICAWNEKRQTCKAEIPVLQMWED